MAGTTPRSTFGRRSALLLPLGLAGCSFIDDLFTEDKPKLPGKREPVLANTRGLRSGDADPGLHVVLPPATENAAWAQAGGNPAHVMGHLQAGDRLAPAWNSRIGSGGGYRAKILAPPVVANGIVYTMDPDAVVSAFDLQSGERRWRFDTKDENDDSTNVGGGLAIEGGTVHAVNGLAELVALDATTGKLRWRQSMDVPARSAPLVAENRLFIATVDNRLIAFATDDGRSLWTYQGRSSDTAMLGQPAPAYSEGLVVAGFGSGELAALRIETGGVGWTDSLASGRGRNNVGDISTVRGLPAIAGGVVYAISLGGLLVATDLRSGRRLWDRQVAGQDSPWVAGDWLFIISSDQQLAAIRRSDGQIAWVSDLPRWENEEKQDDPIQWFGPVLAGDRLIIAGTTGQAMAVSPYTGEILGRQKLGDPASLRPVVAQGTVIIVTDAGRLLALR